MKEGPGRLLVVAYAVFALSAGARAAVQIATRFSDAPLAYLLSLASAVVYLVAAVALVRGRRRLFLAAVVFQLAGVLVVGTVTLVRPLADATVWSSYGVGYGLVPLVLPLLGLLRLRTA